MMIVQKVLSTTISILTEVSESKLEAGDWALVKNVGLPGRHKIADRWSRTVYKVVKQVKDLPVYVVAPFDTDGPQRVLHRDLLLLFYLTQTQQTQTDKKVKKNSVDCG